MCVGDLFMSPFRITKKLNPINATIYFFHNEVANVFKELVEQYEINTVFSHKK
jgi:deoxyribodipyrimidine photo-lyase